MDGTFASNKHPNLIRSISESKIFALYEKRYLLSYVSYTSVQHYSVLQYTDYNMCSFYETNCVSILDQSSFTRLFCVLCRCLFYFLFPSSHILPVLSFSLSIDFLFFFILIDFFYSPVCLSLLSISLVSIFVFRFTCFSLFSFFLFTCFFFFSLLNLFIRIYSSTLFVPCYMLVAVSFESFKYLLDKLILLFYTTFLSSKKHLRSLFLFPIYLYCCYNKLSNITFTSYDKIKVRRYGTYDRQTKFLMHKPLSSFIKTFVNYFAK